MKYLPNVFIPAFPKCGSTAMAYTLCSHPDLVLPEGLEAAAPWAGCWDKEPRFFADHDPAAVQERVQWCEGAYSHTAQLRLDATPDYFVYEGRVEAMARLCPDAKIIVMMREPVARLLSRWNHFSHLHQTGGKAAVHYWHLDPAIGLVENLSNELRAGHPYGELVRPGKYVQHIRMLKKHFPEEQIHYVFQEQWRANPTFIHAQLLTFLGLKAHPLTLSQANTHAWKMENVPHDFIHYLRDLFVSYNGELEDEVGRLPTPYKYWLDEKCCT
jgi:hypothetical protein